MQWNLVLARDNRHDGKLFYAVRTTGIYCRPSCPSRRPRPESVEFFRNSKAAEQAGYRACKRCRPTEIRSQLRIVRMVCKIIEENFADKIGLLAMSAQVGASPYYLQRLFKRTLGVTPRQYHEAQRVKHLRTQLGNGRTVTDALYRVGYGSSSRLYEKAGLRFGMSPKQYQNQGKGSSIAYTVTEAGLGSVLIAATKRGLCSIRLGPSADRLEQELCNEFRSAAIRRDDRSLRYLSEAAVCCLQERAIDPNLAFEIQQTALSYRLWMVLEAVHSGQFRKHNKVANQTRKPAEVHALNSA